MSQIGNTDKLKRTNNNSNNHNHQHHQKKKRKKERIYQPTAIANSVIFCGVHLCKQKGTEFRAKESEENKKHFFNCILCVHLREYAIDNRRIEGSISAH